MPTDGDRARRPVPAGPGAMTWGRTTPAARNESRAEREELRERLHAEALALVTATQGPLAGLLERADALARQAAEHDFDHLVGLAEVTRVDVLTRIQRIPEGSRLGQEVLDRATEAGDRVLAARAHGMLASGLWRLGARVEALSHTEAAVGLLDDSAPLEIQTDLAMRVALMTRYSGAGPVPTSLFERADELARRLGDPDLIVSNLNNLACVQYHSGQLVAARETIGELRAVTAATGLQLSATVFDTIAMVLLDCGETGEAEALITAALRAEAGTTDPDGRGDLLLTYAELKLRNGDTAGALRAALECHRIATERGLAELSPLVLRKLASVHAAMGDYRAAYHALLDSHTEWESLRSREAETTASVMQTVYDLETARRSSRRYQEEAEQDVLTGLWNRRYLDSRLPDLLEESARTGQPLCVALVDLDHFKQVNDRYSHDAGDAVLRAVGGLLGSALDPTVLSAAALSAAALSDGALSDGALSDGALSDAAAASGPTGATAFAVRLGGEEFLLVYPGMDAPATMDACERVRAVMSAHPWSGYGADIVVTASIGVTKAVPGDIASTLLRRVDNHLYRAKRAGRNRVVGDPDPVPLASSLGEAAAG